MSKTINAAVAFALFIRAAAGNKQAAADIRRAHVEAALATVLRHGNLTPWMDGAKEAAAAKGAAAKGLLAGFQAVGHVSALFTPPEAKKMNPEALARAVAEAVAEKVAIFEAAYTEAMPAEKTAAEKEAAKAEKEAAAAVKQAEAVANGIKAEIDAGNLIPADKVLTSADLFRAVLASVAAGQMSDEMADELRAALGVPAMLKQAYNEGKAAAESLALDAAPAPARASRTKNKAASAPAASEAAAPAPEAATA